MADGHSVAWPRSKEQQHTGQRPEHCIEQQIDQPTKWRTDHCTEQRADQADHRTDHCTEQRADHADHRIDHCIVQQTESRAGASLARLFSWTLIGNVVYAACQWAMLVVLAKFGSPEDVGIFSLALALTAPVYLLTNFQLRGILATRTKPNKRETDPGSRRKLEELGTGTYVGFRIVSSCTALLISLLLAVCGGYSGQVCKAIVLVTCAKTIEAICDIVYGWWQQHEKMRWSATSLLLRGVFSFVVFGAIYVWIGQLIPALVGYAVVWLLVLLLHDLPRAKRIEGFGISWKTAEWGSLLRYCWPMGAVMMIVSLQSNVPRYFISHVYGNEELGYFSALMYVMVAGTTIISAIGQSASPRIAQLYASGDKKGLIYLLQRMIWLIGGGSFLLLLAVILAGKPLLTLLYNASYAAYQDMFVWITVASSIGYAASLYGFALTAARKFWSQFMVSLVVLGVLLAYTWLSIIFEGGTIHAAYALVCANIVQFIGSAWLLRKSIRECEFMKQLGV
ncbi:oligosaccharide flippase family protein [Paenibacillus alvei]|uniref:lipopolysaccharide biosynthesis protein n=1 Tax=Paenibacillus alvei TaxID=44250 RepID=UPI00028A1394|nr:oligosaccharide flippase family protein [Paenibacillus alvei]EJW19093.1 polysaccharide biosynthesis protein [Paenibacillus alvei DSM 29]MCY9542264.1 oligosaccharide flippase family protein [Paenibacillus alvei]MCY9707299.1 oligosaccharide flippase family protein [Paenibacillus alvei]MCY9736212.1 oligosaccharide flippase family protein [Paenibacillus alvei]MCY9758254.1 oligosaccharide flippase family protein [Paenibacillus alvei]